VTADVASDLATASRVAGMDRVLQVELLDQLGEVVGIGVEVVALPGLARAAVAAAVMGDAAVAVRGQEEWSSKASAVSGQPWLNTTGCPVPQSL
jgi:hypothetical protein